MGRAEWGRQAPGSPDMCQQPHRGTETITTVQSPDTHSLCEEHLSHGRIRGHLTQPLGRGQPSAIRSL